MAEGSYWTEDRLRAVEAEIDAFARVAFDPALRKHTQRIPKMKDLAAACSDENVRYILARSVAYISRHPDWVSQEIARARGHLATLRENHLRKI